MERISFSQYKQLSESCESFFLLADWEWHLEFDSELFSFVKNNLTQSIDRYGVSIGAFRISPEIPDDVMHKILLWPWVRILFNSSCHNFLDKIPSRILLPIVEGCDFEDECLKTLDGYGLFPECSWFVLRNGDVGDYSYFVFAPQTNKQQGQAEAPTTTTEDNDRTDNNNNRQGHALKSKAKPETPESSA